MHRFALAVTIVAPLALAALPSAASILGHNNDNIQRAAQAGDITPLPKLLQGMSGRLTPGTVIVKAELNEEDDAPSGWKYEINYLNGDEEHEVEVDAKTGQVFDTSD